MATEVAARGPAAGRPPPGRTSPAQAYHDHISLWPDDHIGLCVYQSCMRRNKLAIFIHLIWATWDRQPLITPEIERRLYRCIEAAAIKHGCTVIALNGVSDHVHVLLTLPSAITIADLAKQLKGTSSRFVNEILTPSSGFKWQGSYGAFSVSHADVESVRAYIEKQKLHHESGKLWIDAESAEDNGADVTSD